MTNRELRFEAEELLDRYVQCLDEDRLEEWPDFFVEKCVYKIISRVNVERKSRDRRGPAQQQPGTEAKIITHIGVGG